MLIMKNSLKTSFESDDAEKLDGRKKDQGRRNWGAFALPDYLCQISFTYRGRQIIPTTITTCTFRILRLSAGSERRNDMNEGRHDRKAYSDSVWILNLGGI